MAILNKVSRDDIKTEHMIHWSILSDLIKYIDGSSCSDMILRLTVKPLDYQQHKRLYHSFKTDKDLTSDVIFEGDKVRINILTCMIVYTQRYHRQQDLIKYRPKYNLPRKDGHDKRPNN